MRAVLAAVVFALASTGAGAQTTTTRTDKLIAATSVTIGGTSFTTSAAVLGGTLSVAGASTLASLTATTGTFSGDVAVNGGDVTASVALTLRPTGDLTLDPTGDVILGPDGADVLPASTYAVNLGALTAKYLTVHAAELWVSSLVAQQTIATIGGRILVGATTQLANPLASGDPAIYLKHNSFANGDLLVLESNGQFEVVQLTSTCYAPCSSAPYVYNVSHNVDGSGANSWQAGDAVFSIQSSWIDLYSIAGLGASTDYGPTMVGQVRNSSTWNDWSERWAVGRLDGLYGYTSTSCGGVPCYGVGLGKWESNVVTIDPSNGVRMLYNGAVLGSWSGSTVTLGQPLTSNNTGQIVIDSDSIDVKWRNNAGSTSTILQVANNSGVGQVTVSGTLSATTLLSSTVKSDSGGMLIISTSPAQDITVQVSGAVVPYADNTVPFGSSSAAWNEIYADLTTTTTDYNPIVVNPTTGQFLEKTDGISATFNPTTCSSMTFHSGLLVAKVGC